MRPEPQWLPRLSGVCATIIAIICYWSNSCRLADVQQSAKLDRGGSKGACGEIGLYGSTKSATYVNLTSLSHKRPETRRCPLLLTSGTQTGTPISQQLHSIAADSLTEVIPPGCPHTCSEEHRRIVSS
jgi:hypothetical protein